jgi:hypothetical protein
MMTPSALPSDRHWATVPTPDLPGVLEVLKQRFWKSLEDSGRLYLWRKSERTYYGEDEWGGWKESAAVSFGGESGEQAYIRINEYRSLLISILSMCTADRPAFYAKAVNTSSQALIEAPIATGLIAFYYNDKRIDDLVQTTVERTLVLGEGFIHLRWDNLAGPPLGQNPQTGVMVYEGDIAPAAVSPLSVIRDTKEAPDQMTWCAPAHWENLWNLVAAYPQYREQLIAQRGAAWWPDNVWSDEFTRSHLGEEVDPDRVVVWCLYHQKSPAVPRGRYALICGDVVLTDEPMKLDEIPVYCCVTAKHMDKNEGNAPAWDLLAPQDAYDSLWSSILTVHDSWGLNYYVPKGSGITAKQIAGGQRLIEYNPNPNAMNNGMPTAMPLATIPSAGYEVPGEVRERMQTLSGVNSVARGEVDDNVKSGTMAALIQSLAAKFNSASQRATVRLHERVSAGLLKQLRLYGSTKKVSEVAGSGAAEYLQSIAVEDVEQVQKVQVETANPLTQQMAGRLELGEKMAQLFPGKMTMEHFATLVETGQLKPLLKRSEAMLAQIARENDLLAKGQLPPVAYRRPEQPGLPGQPPKPAMDFTCHTTDDHAIHVMEHAALLTTEFRADPAKMAAFDEHTKHHYVLWADMPQDLAALTGQSLPPPAPMGMPPDGEPGEAGPEEPKGAAPPAKDAKKEPEKARPLGGQPQPNMPSMPRPAGGGPPIPA